MDAAVFPQRVLAWFSAYGRHDLPWQNRQDVYAVWVSEIMLQQTQVQTVIPYFTAFITRFPTLQSLAQASWDDVSPYWAGLGYYARARNLHRAAIEVAVHGFPLTLADWQALPGIGRSTAGALMSLGQGQFGVILDGNVKRVLTRVFAIDEDMSKQAALEKLWTLATQLTPQSCSAEYNQAMMDLGATCCTRIRPQCDRCPLQQQCQACKTGQQLYFPVKKKSSARPVRKAQVLIVENEAHQWLWLKRPVPGIWGGLWSLPVFEVEPKAPWHTVWRCRHQVPEEIKHVFTHFSWQLQLTHTSVHTSESQWLTQIDMPWRWMDGAQALDQGIPSAMRKIIMRMQNKHANQG